jgi:hypothetical protein
MMSAASGTIRIPTRRCLLHAISQFDKIQVPNPGGKLNKMTTLILTDAHEREKVADTHYHEPAVPPGTGSGPSPASGSLLSVIG